MSSRKIHNLFDYDNKGLAMEETAENSGKLELNWVHLWKAVFGHPFRILSTTRN